MKIRKGFVSNSSSSSFCIIGDIHDFGSGKFPEYFNKFYEFTEAELNIIKIYIDHYTNWDEYSGLIEKVKDVFREKYPDLSLEFDYEGERLAIGKIIIHQDEEYDCNEIDILKVAKEVEDALGFKPHVELTEFSR